MNAVKFSVALSLLLFGFPSGLLAESRVQVQAGDTVDTFARTHLKNPRKWRAVLKHNNLTAANFRTGLTIRIPRGLERRGDAYVKFVEPASLVSSQIVQNWIQVTTGNKLFTGDRLKTNKLGKLHLIFRPAGFSVSIEPGAAPGALVQLPAPPVP